MPTPSAFEICEICRTDLFTREPELQERYPQIVVDKVLRIREMYNWFISNPDGTDCEFVAELCQRHDISKVTEYADLAIVKTLLTQNLLRGLNRNCIYFAGIDNKNKRTIRLDYPLILFTN